MEESETLAVAENQTYIQDEWLPGAQLGRSVPLGQRVVRASGCQVRNWDVQCHLVRGL